MQMYTGTRLTTAIHRRLLSRCFLREGGGGTFVHRVGFLHWTVSNLFFRCVTVKTIYSLYIYWYSDLNVTGVSNILETCLFAFYLQNYF